MQAMTITDRVILWNKQRYEQEYNYDLAAQLLLEETSELFEAKSDIDKLDAIGDIFFVAIGVFWKLGLPNEVIQRIFHDLDLTKATIEETNDLCNNIEYAIMEEVSDVIGAYPGIKLACYSAFICALGTLRGMNMQHTIYDIVHAICDSNHTKEIKGKTPSHIKANINKGKGYKPPTEALMNIYKQNKIIH
jgi:hypothetical protein